MVTLIVSEPLAMPAVAFEIKIYLFICLFIKKKKAALPSCLFRIAACSVCYLVRCQEIMLHLVLGFCNLLHREHFV